MPPQDLFLIGAMVLLVAMFFFSNRLRKAMMKQQEEQRARDMHPGVRVMLGSGMYGYIVEYDADDLNKPVKLEIAPGTIVEVHSQAIARVAPLEDESADEATDSVTDVAESSDAADEASSEASSVIEEAKKRLKDSQQRFGDNDADPKKS